VVPLARGDRGAEPHSATPPTASQGEWPSQPRFGYGLEFFAALTVNLIAEPIGVTPEGYRINFYIRDGGSSVPASTPSCSRRR
jgi:hypothetical protein